MAEDTNYLLKCIDCGAEFFTKGQRDFYNSIAFNMPNDVKCVMKRRRLGMNRYSKKKSYKHFYKTVL